MHVYIRNFEAVQHSESQPPHLMIISSDTIPLPKISQNLKPHPTDPHTPYRVIRIPNAVMMMIK